MERSQQLATAARVVSGQSAGVEFCVCDVTASAAAHAYLLQWAPALLQDGDAGPDIRIGGGLGGVDGGVEARGPAPDHE